MTVQYQQDTDRINDIAAKAWARLKKDEVAPLPHYFEVWFVYYASEHVQLKEEINGILQSKNALEPTELTIIYDKYLSDSRHEQLFQKAGDHIHNAIEDVSGIMDNIREATTEYSTNLNTVNDKLSNAATKEELEVLLRDVMAETGKMIEHNRLLEQHLDQSVAIMNELKDDLEQVRREAMTDGLTGLTNRKSFDEKIRQTVRQSVEEEKTFSLLLLDIDHFKAFNDNYGHLVGDQVLRLVAKTLTDGVKGRDTAARYGGEEFAIILPDTNIEGARMVAENLRKAIAQKEVINRTTGAHLGRITISIGVAQFYAGEQVDDLIERTDGALYTAKHNGRNQVATAPTPHARVKQA